MFPIIENDVINDVIQKHHIPLLHGIIKQESNFKEVIKSKVGARGLMQVMPATAKFICHSHGIQFNQRKLNYDADYNIKLGTLYISDLLKRYDGSYILALMAYNAGYGSVGKWENSYSHPQTISEMMIFIELTPFKETRNYVKKIIEYEAIYEYLISEEG
jgi:soluble lytic murein transglycosylase